MCGLGECDNQKSVRVSGLSLVEHAHTHPRLLVLPVWFVDSLVSLCISRVLSNEMDVKFRNDMNMQQKTEEINLKQHSILAELQEIRKQLNVQDKNNNNTGRKPGVFGDYF